MRSAILLLVVLFAVDALAEKPKDKSSANYANEKKDYLPGEEVVTPTGQKLKVWSTQGAIEVGQQNPQPANTNSGNRDIRVIVDDRQEPEDDQDSFSLDQ